MKKLWFKAKRYGWGWTPATWQGWGVTAAFVVFEIWNFLRIDSSSHSASDTLLPFAAQTFLAIIIFIYICYRTGEKPSWHWGDKK